MARRTSWDRILRWCEEYAPATAAAVLPPVTDDERWRAERETGGWPWPDNVVDFYERCDGLERSPAGYLLPGWRPLTLDEVVRTWELLLVTDAEVVGGLTIPDLQGQERKTYLANLVAGEPQYVDFYTVGAGTPTGRFIPPWLPIAEDMNGDHLVVDRRIGDRYGCLIEIDKVNVDHRARQWSSLTSLLRAVADAVQDGEPVRGSSYRPVAGSGTISWRCGVDPERSPATIVRRYFEMWNTGDTTDADNLLHPDWRDHAHPEIEGVDGIADAVARGRRERPSVRFRIDAVLGDQDLVAVAGAVTDPDVGTVESLAWIVRLDRGRLAEMWTYRSSDGYEPPS